MILSHPERFKVTIDEDGNKVITLKDKDEQSTTKEFQETDVRPEGKTDR